MLFRRIRQLAGALACCGFLFLSPAFSQDRSAANPQAPSWTLKMPALLHLDEAQETAFQSYAKTLSRPSAQPPAVSASQFGAMTSPERLDFIADHMAADLTVVRGQAEAMRRFYASLRPEQRTKFDEATRPAPERIGVPGDPIDQPHPDKPDYSLPSHTNPDWLIKPRGEDMARVYPTEALRRGLEGSVILMCVADENGYLKDCVVQDEAPKDMGFGNAALEMSAYMRMIPASDYGVPRPAQVNIPLNFNTRE